MEKLKFLSDVFCISSLRSSKNKGGDNIKPDVKKTNKKQLLPKAMVDYIERNLFPGIKSFKIANKEKDKIYQVFNLNKTSRELKFEKLHSKQRSYLRKSLYRLARYAVRGQQFQFQCLMLILLKKSHSLRVRGMYKAFRGYHKKYNIKFVLSTLRIASSLMKNLKFSYEYNRVWIPKSNNSKELRPLSVSPIYWRIVANTLQLFLILWIFPRMPDHRFHGGLPSRGPGSWWKYVLKNKLHKSKYVFEFDMAKYFDTIDDRAVEHALFLKGVPPLLIDFVFTMIKDHVRCLEPKEAKQEAHNRASAIGRFAHAWNIPEMNGLPQGLSFSPLLSTLVMEYALNRIPERKELYKNVITYVDDGIMFYDEAIDIGMRSKQYWLNPRWDLSNDLRKTGSPVNSEKSRYFSWADFTNVELRVTYLLVILSFTVFSEVLINPIVWMILICLFIWLKDFPQSKYFAEIKREKSFKFCGVEYISGRDTIKGKTRNGSELEFPSADYEKLDELVFEGYIDPKRASKHLNDTELAISLDLFDPILGQIYNDGEVYIDELSNSRSTFYSLPPELNMQMLSDCYHSRMYGHKMDSLVLFEQYTLERLIGEPLTDYNASSASSLFIALNSSMIYDKHKLSRRYNRLLFKLVRKYKNIFKARDVANKIIASY